MVSLCIDLPLLWPWLKLNWNLKASYAKAQCSKKGGQQAMWQVKSLHGNLAKAHLKEPVNTIRAMLQKNAYLILTLPSITVIIL